MSSTKHPPSYDQAPTSTWYREDGPQSERSKRLKALTSEDSPPITTKPVASLPEIPPVGVETSESELLRARAEEEKNFLTGYVERLLNQLRELLEKYGELDKLPSLTNSLHAAFETDVDTSEPLPSWMTAKDCLNPVFQAYDGKIKELEAMLADNTKSMENVSSRAEAIAKENTTLRQELEAAGERAVLQEAKGREDFLSTDMTTLADEEALQQMGERVEIFMSENRMLSEQISLQEDELQSLRKTIEGKDQRIQTLEQHFNQVSLALQQQKSTCQSLEQERASCENLLQQHAITAGREHAEKEELKSQIHALQSAQESSSDHLQQYEELLANAKKSASKKEDQFTQRYQTVCTRLKDLNSQVTAKESKIDELEEKNRELESELDTVKQDCEGMLNVLTRMEKQLSQYASREEAVTELETQSKVRVEEVTLEKEQIEARESFARQEITQLLERLKRESEQHVKEMQEKGDAVTKKLSDKLTRSQEKAQRLEEDWTQVRTKLDAVTRQKQQTEKELEDLRQHSLEAKKQFEYHLKLNKERALAAEEERDALRMGTAEMEEKIKAKGDELQTLHEEHKALVRSSGQKVVRLQEEIGRLASQVKQQSLELEDKSHRLSQCQGKLAKAEAEVNTKVDREVGSLRDQNRRLQAQLSDAEVRLAETTKQTSFSSDASRRELERTVEKWRKEVETLERSSTILKEDRQQTEKARQELAAKAKTLSLQILHMSEELQEVKEQLNDRDQELEESEQKINELSSQLTVSFSKQQQAYRQERETKIAREKLVLEKARVERELSLCRKKLEAANGEQTKRGQFMLKDASVHRQSRLLSYSPSPSRHKQEEAAQVEPLPRSPSSLHS